MDKVVYRQNRGKESDTKRGVEIPKFLNSWVIQVVLVVVSVILLYSVYKSVNITSQKLDILKQAEREVKELRLQNLHLSIEMKDMSTDQYLEKEARNRLNFGKDGEIVFVLPPSTMLIAKEEVNRILEDRPAAGKLSNFLSVWVQFVLNGV